MEKILTINNCYDNDRDELILELPFETFLNLLKSFYNL